jgi:hypothetical protein
VNLFTRETRSNSTPQGSKIQSQKYSDHIQTKDMWEYSGNLKEIVWVRKLGTQISIQNKTHSKNPKPKNKDVTH